MIPENNSNKKGAPKGDGPKLPKFNVYWIYGLIALSLLSARFFQMAPDIITTTEQEFKQVMLTRGDVERIDLVQNKELVRVYIKPDSIEKDFYVQKLKRKIEKAKVKGVPLFEFSVTDWNSFNERLQKFYEQKSIQEVPQNTVKEGEWFGPIANTIFSLGLLVVVWVLLMRKMGGGGGSGGGPGGIFNVGKSKATLFEKGGTKVNITFADVAGLEEAKEEVM
jgi:cell division protease FtsH